MFQSHTEVHLRRTTKASVTSLLPPHPQPRYFFVCAVCKAHNQSMSCQSLLQTTQSPKPLSDFRLLAVSPLNPTSPVSHVKSTLDIASPCLEGACIGATHPLASKRSTFRV